MSGDKKKAAEPEKPVVVEAVPTEPKDVPKDKSKKEKKPVVVKTEEQLNYDKDYQLARALDLLRGIYVYKKIETR